jgi:hypothetical protein
VEETWNGSAWTQSPGASIYLVAGVPWANIRAQVLALAPMPGPIYLDPSSLVPYVAGVLGEVTDLHGMWFEVPVLLVDVAEVQIADGAQLRNLGGNVGGCVRGVVLVGTSTGGGVTPPLDWDVIGVHPNGFLIASGGGRIRNDGTVPMAIVPNGRRMQVGTIWNGFLQDGAFSAPIVQLGVGSGLFVPLQYASPGNIGPTVFGSVDASSTIDIENDGGFDFTAVASWTNFTGTVVNTAFDLQGGAGPTAYRPINTSNGVKYFDTDLGLPIWWSDTLVAWVEAGTGSGIYWATGVPWATIRAKIAAQAPLPGPIYLQSSLTPYTAGVAAEVTDLHGMWFEVVIADVDGPNNCEIDIADGAQLRNLGTGGARGVTLVGLPTGATPSLDWDNPFPGNDYGNLNSSLGGSISNNGSTPMVVVPGGAFMAVQLLDNAVLNGGGVGAPVVELGVGSFLAVVYQNSRPGNINPTAIGGPASAVVIIENGGGFNFDGVAAWVNFPVSPSNLLNQDVDLQGGSGPTGYRPNNPSQGTQYYDTTIGKPFWWNDDASVWETYGLTVAVAVTNASAPSIPDSAFVFTQLGNWSDVTPNDVNTGPSGAPFNTVTGTFTAPVDGDYLVDSHIQFSSAAANFLAPFQVGIFVGGALRAADTYRNLVAGDGGAATRDVRISRLLRLTAGTTVDIRASQGDGLATAIPLTADATANMLSIMLVGS